MMLPERDQLVVDLPKPLHRKLKALSHDAGLPLNAFVSVTLNEKARTGISWPSEIPNHAAIQACCFRIPKDLKKRIEAQAAKDEASVVQWVRVALQEVV